MQYNNVFYSLKYESLLQNITNKFKYNFIMVNYIIFSEKYLIYLPFSLDIVYGIDLIS